MKARALIDIPALDVRCGEYVEGPDELLKPFAVEGGPLDADAAGDPDAEYRQLGQPAPVEPAATPSAKKPRG